MAMGEEMMTRRERMMEMMRQGPISMQHLANFFRVEMRELSDDMEHIRRSVKGEAELIIDPAACKGCGFQFRERSRIKTPSKCPRCRGERILPATFFIKEKKRR